MELNKHEFGEVFARLELSNRDICEVFEHPALEHHDFGFRRSISLSWYYKRASFQPAPGAT